MTSTTAPGGARQATRLWPIALLAVALTGTLAACSGTNAGNISDWVQDKSLKNTAVMPSEDALKARRTRVVVLASEDSPTTPRGAGLSEVATATLEGMFGKGTVEVVERKLAAALDKELKIAEMNSSGASYNGPEVADYAVKVVMGSVSFKSAFQNESEFKNPLTGKPVKLPAGYDQEGRSNMTVRIYAVPSLRLVRSIPIEGKATVGRAPRPADGQTAIVLVRTATESGLKSKQDDVLDEFGAKAYVTDKRTKEKDKLFLFRINVGKQAGVAQGNEVAFFTLRPEKDLSGTEVYDESLIGTGIVTEQVGDTSSWVIVKDVKTGNSILRGDIVRIKQAGCSWDNMKACVTKLAM